ncbi:MAG TPA: hypothetical protein DDW54_03385, partial [Clostridiales bacterium]|nr:hypothetical protein [Clostridiales bacterium]
GYGGETQWNFRSSGYGSSFMTADKFVWGVRRGLGSNGACVGPEYGIAKAINGQYEGAADGRKAFIFKTGAGGTALRDIDSGNSALWGNWYPRSLWPDGYAPNTATNDTKNDATGYLYARFLYNFGKVYDELKAAGYEPQIKGFAWMQGCDDLGHHTEYEGLLKAFIADMRTDLAEITGDSAVYGMPFVIGKIATTFVSHSNSNVPPFNAMQQKVADDMGNGVETIETSDLIIVNADGTYNGTDQYHFNCADMEKLGVRFGERLLELNGRKIIAVSSQQEGTVSYRMTDDGKAVFTVSAGVVGTKKYKISKLFINDVDVTAQMENGVYTLENPENRTYARAEFVEKDKYTVTYNTDDRYVSILKSMRSVYENDDVLFEFAVKDGYRIKEVKANGETVMPSEEGKARYTIENVTGNVTVDVAVESASGTPSEDAQKPDTPAKTPENKGGNTVLTITLIAVGGAVVICGAVAAVIVIKKKKKTD